MVLWPLHQRLLRLRLRLPVLLPLPLPLPLLRPLPHLRRVLLLALHPHLLQQPK